VHCHINQQEVHTTYELFNVYYMFSRSLSQRNAEVLYTMDQKQGILKYLMTMMTTRKGVQVIKGWNLLTILFPLHKKINRREEIVSFDKLR